MLDIAREEQSNPVELKFFRGTTGANVVADATPDADRTLRLRSTVPHFSQYPYIGLGHSYTQAYIGHREKCISVYSQPKSPIEKRSGISDYIGPGSTPEKF